MLNKLPEFITILGIKTRSAFKWSGLFVFILCIAGFLGVSFPQQDQQDTITKADKFAEEGDYKKAYELLYEEVKELQTELDNQAGLVEYYKSEVSKLKGDALPIADYKYNGAANRLWASAWKLQHDGIFKKMGQEKEATLEKSVLLYKRITIDYPHADKAEEAQFRVGRIYFKFIKNHEMAAKELQRYLGMYPKGKYASDVKAMLRKITGK